MVDKAGEARHGVLDPAGPGTIKWLHHRLVKVSATVNDPATAVPASAAGVLDRVGDNGLGFDVRRIGSLGDRNAIFVDPVVETLAFFALAVLPLRGDGSDERIASSSRRPRQRRSTRDAPFTWIAWRYPLSADAIDALLDQPTDIRLRSGLGVIAAWSALAYESRGSADATRALGGRRVW
ncbi:MAG: hypothetical protein R2705_11530 [Ilumatobacteraceae bacterium]